MTEDYLKEKLESSMAELFLSIPLLTGALLASVDGRVVAAHMPPDQQPSTAAITASSFALGQRLAALTGNAELQEMVVRSPGGYVGIYAVGTDKAMVVTGRPTINLGLLNLKARTVIKDLESIVAGTQEWAS